MNHFEPTRRKLILGMALSMSAIFLLDLQTPLGVADGVLYIFPVGLSLWLKRKRETCFAAVACVLLVLLGYLFSPPLVTEAWVVIANRGISIVVILIAAVFGLAYKEIVVKSERRKDLLETIISDSFDALVKIDSTGRVLGWNKSSEGIFGWLRDEAMGRSIAELIIPPQYRDAHHEGLQRFLTKGDRGIINQHIEITALRRDGVEFPVELTVSAIKRHEDYVFSAVIRDITHRKHLEKQNQLYTVELANSLKKEQLQGRALEVANVQMRHFSKQVENNLLELEGAYLQTLNSLSLAAEFKDEDTGTHLVRISRYCRTLAKAASLSEEEVKSIALASPMHDIGKVGIPDIVLQKKGKLTDAEFKLMMQHTHIGAEILGNSDAPIIVLARSIALSHHEKWNGLGYPRGLAGESIPVSARIVGLVDCFDALTSSRPYKDPYPLETASLIIAREKGKSFDPYLVELFMKSLDEFKEVVETNPSYLAGRNRHFQLSARDQVEWGSDKPWWTGEFLDPGKPATDKDKMAEET